MDDDLNNIIEGALVLGFIAEGDNELRCTRDQLVMFSALIAQEAIRQALEERDKE